MQILNIINIGIRIALYIVILNIRMAEKKLDCKNAEATKRIIKSILMITFYSMTLFFLPIPFAGTGRIKTGTDVLIVMGLLVGYVAVLVATVMWTLKACEKVEC